MNINGWLEELLGIPSPGGSEWAREQDPAMWEDVYTEENEG